LLRVVPDAAIVDNIVQAMKDVRMFAAFDSTIRLGVTVDANSIPFERLMLFGWIKDLINERKN
jgi:hypothetical protein